MRCCRQRAERHNAAGCGVLECRGGEVAPLLPHQPGPLQSGPASAAQSVISSGDGPGPYLSYGTRCFYGAMYRRALTLEIASLAAHSPVHS